MAAGEQAGQQGGPGRGRSIAVPAFPDDDGQADPSVRRLLASGAPSVARALRGVRLLASVVAVADAVDASGADKDSHMAVVSMVSERGERGLLAFTGTDSLSAWDPAARPVPARGCDVARSALTDGAAAVVIDVAGPMRVVIAGSDLLVLADQLDLESVEPLIRSALAPVLAIGAEIAIRDARGESAEVDVLVEVSADAASPGVAEEVAALLAAHPAIARAVPGGIGVLVAGKVGS